MASTIWTWLSLIFFLTIPLWAPNITSDDPGNTIALLAVTHGLNTVARYSYPAAYAGLDHRFAWILDFSLNLVTCIVTCDFFSAVEGWRWALLYVLVVVRWANPVLEAEKDFMLPLIETYRFKYDEPQRMSHFFRLAAIATIITPLNWAKGLGGLQLAAIWVHLILSAGHVMAAWTYFTLTDEQKKSTKKLRRKDTVKMK
ncbi:hypothetical protein K505DRAFT_356261 [Melanomma pulvis-pyrius CBS 109.77]|uniref:Uncharacterized protein n=1 Tax=Melanomma pulvis-pyrius CBS 109.77 TaxID=1314802 RepID=A0A6A6XVJ1_9PLEO|nr:hypothetical protein K505DRAFT_356261 [Melanomma pulvis-pyrius CBS 109.77]